MTQLAAWAAGPDQHQASNKLLAHKSSFQAWKCVSFGCSLLAAVLLLSKWYEVSTDLNMLLGIERLLLVQEAQKSAPMAGGPAHSSADKEALSWPPVPIEAMLPAHNDSGFGMESMRDNSSMLMSHMHLSLGRELAADHLLREEIDAFVGEFKMAKSTLSLSVMLVAVYIISWVLMTLAINDTRISNDISLRNILLLSVFGAIDVAASVGFVMVRLIMYSVKNHSFASRMVASSGLKDAPTRLSADQVTAFTALRLIGMRSCSAYVDIYVSVVMALLTVLRLYAITRALGYYRRLRRLTDPLDQLQQQGELKQQAIWSSSYFNAQPSGVFAAHQLISPAANQPPADRSFRLAPDPYEQQQQQFFQHATSPGGDAKGSYRYRTGSEPPTTTATSKLAFDFNNNNNQQVIAPKQRRASAKINQNDHHQHLPARTRATPKPQSSDGLDGPDLLLVNEQADERRRLVGSVRLGGDTGKAQRLFQAASLGQLNRFEGATDAGRSYTLLRANQLERAKPERRDLQEAGRYRLVEVARFKGLGPSKGASASSSSSECADSSAQELVAGETDGARPKRRPARRHRPASEQQHFTSMSPKQVVEVSNKSSSKAEPLADSFLLSKYYYA